MLGVIKLTKLKLQHSTEMSMVIKDFVAA